MLVITLGGIFVISTLIGILNTGLEGKLAELRKGRSRVVERDHTVILGWSQQIFTIISELVDGQREPARAARSSSWPTATRSRWRTRSGPGSARPARRSSSAARGSPMDLDDLDIASLQTARSIIVLAPEGDEPDADVIKTLLAITNDPSRRPEPYHIVAEIRDRANLDVARMVGRDEVELVLVGDLIARITAQTCRQSGPVGGLHRAARLRRRRDLLDRGAGAGRADVRRRARGVRRRDRHRAAARPAGRRSSTRRSDTVIGAGDRLIVIAEDDDPITAAAAMRPPIDEAWLREAPARTPAPGADARPRLEPAGARDHRASSTATSRPGSETLVAGGRAPAIEADDRAGWSRA